MVKVNAFTMTVSVLSRNTASRPQSSTKQG